MEAGGDHGQKELAELGIGIPNTGGTVVLLEVVPDLLHHSKMGDGSLDQRGHLQGDVAKCLLIVLVPQFMLIGRLGGTINKPLALGPEIGLHGGVPLLPVETGEDRDHLVESAGHGAKDSVGSQRSQQVNATLDKQEEEYT